MSITAIVPAYNESAGIEQVLAVLKRMDCLSEVIVVDDGSTDDTQMHIQKAVQADSRIRSLRHATNRGKGQAIFTGWHAAQGSILLLVDADLSHLTSQHLESLISPVTAQIADMTVGLLTQNGRINQWYCALFPWLSGQRCFRVELMSLVSEQAAAGYGLETALHLAARRKGWRTHTVPFNGVTHPIRSFTRASLRLPASKLWAFPNIVRAWCLSELEGWRHSRDSIEVTH